MIDNIEAAAGLARASMACSDSADDYQARRLALGMQDSDPRSSAEIAAEIGIKKPSWLSPTWRSALNRAQACRQ